MRQFLIAILLMTGLAACESKHYESPSRTLDDCFWQPWRPNC